MSAKHNNNHKRLRKVFARASERLDSCAKPFDNLRYELLVTSRAALHASKLQALAGRLSPLLLDLQNLLREIEGADFEQGRPEGLTVQAATLEELEALEIASDLARVPEEGSRRPDLPGQGAAGS